MKTFLTIISVMAFAMISANSQPPPAAATSSGGEATGKVVEFAAGASIVLDEGGGQPVHYKLGKYVTYLNARGRMVKGGKMKKDRKVRVHFTKDGNDRVVDKITVVKN